MEISRWWYTGAMVYNWRQAAVPEANTVNLKDPDARGHQQGARLQTEPRREAVSAAAPSPLPERPGATKPVGAPTNTAGKRPNEAAARARLSEHTGDERWQHELKEMRVTHDLDEIDDDVEREATLFEWQAEEHAHRPKSPLWFAALAAGATVAIGLQLFFFANFIGSLTIALIAGLLYYIAQQQPAMMRYRIMVDGVALNNTLYHYEDLDSFNVIYEPGETKTVIFRSQRRFAPYLHMEIGDADPVKIRDILLEFLPEDQALQEPLVDILARRLGF